MYGDTMYTAYPSKNISPKMVTIGGWNMYEATLFILQQIYILVYAHVGLVSYNEPSVHGQESIKIALNFVCNYKVYPIFSDKLEINPHLISMQIRYTIFLDIKLFRLEFHMNIR